MVNFTRLLVEVPIPPSTVVLAIAFALIFLYLAVKVCRTGVRLLNDVVPLAAAIEIWVAYIIFKEQVVYNPEKWCSMYGTKIPYPTVSQAIALNIQEDGTSLLRVLWIDTLLITMSMPLILFRILKYLHNTHGRVTLPILLWCVNTAVVLWMCVCLVGIAALPTSDEAYCSEGLIHSDATKAFEQSKSKWHGLAVNALIFGPALGFVVYWHAPPVAGRLSFIRVSGVAVFCFGCFIACNKLLAAGGQLCTESHTDEDRMVQFSKWAGITICFEDIALTFILLLAVLVTMKNFHMNISNQEMIKPGEYDTNVDAIHNGSFSIEGCIFLVLVVGVLVASSQNYQTVYNHIRLTSLPPVPDLPGLSATTMTTTFQYKHLECNHLHTTTDDTQARSLFGPSLQKMGLSLELMETYWYRIWFWAVIAGWEAFGTFRAFSEDIKQRKIFVSSEPLLA
jgi:hypothetical protein